MSFLNSFINLFGTKSGRDLKKLSPLVYKINDIYSKLENISNDELRLKTKKFKQILNDEIIKEKKDLAELKEIVKSKDFLLNPDDSVYNKIDDTEKTIYSKQQNVLEKIKLEAFAVMKETARRFSINDQIKTSLTDFDKHLAESKQYINISGNDSIWMTTWESGGVSKKWDMLHYDVQLIGGMVLHEGKIAEMQTGEGKTLVATLPIYLNALTSDGVHVVTVNDYLAKRDSEWMGPLFEFHGLSVDCIDKYSPNSKERKKAYKSDIIYGTNNEFGFDYLRDNMAISSDDLVQRKLNFTIIDEVDSVLIDDARTPLIISGAVKKNQDQEFQNLKPYIEKIVKEQKGLVQNELIDAKRLLGEENKKDGGEKLFRCFRGLPKNKALIKFLSEDGIKTILQKTENFYLKDQSREMHIIDEKLFFTIDEKNNSVDLTDKGIDYLSNFSEDKDFFILPDIGSKIAELESIEDELVQKKKKEDLLRNFSIKSERIHTLNQLLKAYTLFEKDIEYVILENKVKIVDEQTGRIMEGRRYSDGLHQAIESKENCKIESATQTLASITLQNFFRMYNKISGMTGTAVTESGEFWDIYKLDVVEVPTNKKVVRKDANDYVYKTNREKYNAVVDEIINLNEQDRPVLVGTTSVEISELISRYLKRAKIRHNVLNAKLHKSEADIVAEAGEKNAVTIATNMAGRGTDIKLNDDVKNAGGLAIIGTERHDSRRVDRQLRGRSGRQGDPGSSQFFVSLEDNLMRLFGSDRIAKLMDRMGHKEGEVIQHGMINRSIERAQKKVEENNFGIRKRLLEYDDVMNSQRSVIYKRRRNALIGLKLSLDILNSFEDFSYNLLAQFHADKDYSNFTNEFLKIFSLECPISLEDFNSKDISFLHEKISKYIFSEYQQRTENIKNEALPVLKSMYENDENQFKNILIPFSDGLKSTNVICNLEKCVSSSGEQIIKDFERSIVLSTIDQHWKDHLRELDDLKQSAQGAVYEQKDPILIYKLESFKLFEEMINKINFQIITFLFKSRLPIRKSNEISEAKLRTTQIGTAGRGKIMQNHKKNPTSNSSANQPQLSRRQRRMRERGSRR